jgi:hypothetical protein
MLRTALLCIALLFALGCSGAALAGSQGAWPPALWGWVLVVCVLFERWRYQPKAGADPGDWQATGEQFIDPETGAAQRVEYSPATGQRRYVSAKE